MFYSKVLSKFQNLKHCFYSRNNGFSKGIYKSLNCGLGSKDIKDDVIKNLSFIAKDSGVDLNDLKLMHQTHGNNVIIVNETNKDSQNFKSDSLITQMKNVAIGVLTADCVPIILSDDSNKTIVCIHAGWRGTFTGIIEKTLNEFSKFDKDSNIYAVIGPCIGKKNYEIGNDFYLNFINKSKVNKIYFTKINGKLYFNLRKYVENKLFSNGVIKIDNIIKDTFEDSSNFYSYRRSIFLGEHDYGRCIATICLK